MSYGLDKFEESSLRGSLPRRTYRGVHASSHFVTNPLVHLDLNTQKFHKNTNLQVSHISQENFNCPTTSDDTNYYLNSLNYYTEIDNHLNYMNNPIFEDDNEFIRPLIRENTPVDRDSGMYSINSNENFEFVTPNWLNKNLVDDETSLKLNWNKNFDENEKKWLLKNGKKYWTLDSNKFHTFGGIKRRRKKFDYIEENIIDNKDKNLQDNDTDFTKFKFQTFGGIKSGNKIDKKEIIAYKNCFRVRPSMKLLAKAPKHLRQSNLVDFNQKTAADSTEEVASLDGDNLRLEPPLIPQIIHRHFTSLTDLRREGYQNAKSSSKSSRKGLSSRNSLFSE